MDAADLSPVPESQRTQPAFDLFLIYIAANVVATTLQTGAVLGSRYGGTVAIVLTIAGAAFGALLVALLAPVGSRWGVPSMVAARMPLGHRGAQIVSVVLFLTNFAWIAINNQIAASACAAVLGGPSTLTLWSAALGVASTIVVAAGPRAVGFADRFAVPVMAIAGAALTYSAITLARPAPTAMPSSADLLWGLDVVIGYQVSWLLMFADYSRYTRSAARATVAVWAGLALPAFWLMPLGLTLAQVAGSDDPGRMLASLGQGWWTAALITLASVTTNFVNIYMSSLAWRTLSPNTTGARSIWTIGLIGTGLGLISSLWLTRFAEWMVLIGSILVPVGGVFLAHFVVLRRSLSLDVVYDPRRVGSFNVAGMMAWVAGFIVYKLAAPIGATLPALATSMLIYWAVAKRRAP
ncbi:MAG TPA: cytosine permease [Vicinamibacterales bacterium]|nr:cytosine permease [Vicinamibacterales bacterium]